MNDQQLIEALRAIGDRPAVPDAEFRERLWRSRPSPRQVRGRSGRPGLLLVAAALVLLALAVAASVGAQLLDRRPLLTDVSTPAPSSSIADATSSIVPASPPSLPTFVVHIPDGLTPTSSVDAIAASALAVDDSDLDLPGESIHEITLLEPGTRYPGARGALVTSDRPVWAVSVWNRAGHRVDLYLIDGTMALAGAERAEAEPAATPAVLPTWDPAVPLKLVGETGRAIRPQHVPIFGPGLPRQASAPVAIGDDLWVLQASVYTDEPAQLVRVDMRTGAVSRIALPDMAGFGGRLETFGGRLWVWTSALIREVDLATGAFGEFYGAPSGGGSFVGVDGDGLWFRIPDGIALMDPDTGDEIRRIATPETGNHSYRGFWQPPAFGSLWDVHRGTATVLRIDRVSGETIATIDLDTADPDSCSDPRPLIGLDAEPALLVVSCRDRQFLVDPATSTVHRTIGTDGSLLVANGQLWTTRSPAPVAWREPGVFAHVDPETGHELEVLRFNRDRTAAQAVVVAGDSIWMLVGELADRDEGYDQNTALIRIPLAELTR